VYVVIAGLEYVFFSVVYMGDLYRRLCLPPLDSTYASTVLCPTRNSVFLDLLGYDSVVGERSRCGDVVSRFT